jgi:hypothetical protein
MTYTFWHAGILIGESDFEEASDHPRQRGGVFRPTAYGIQVFPRISGMLSAGNALKTYLDEKGLSAEELNPDEIEDLLDRTPAGQRIIDIGRMLSQVEVRAANGRPLEFATIAFSDPGEIERLLREMEIGPEQGLEDLPSEAPRYIVSATLRHDAPAWGNERRGRPARDPVQRKRVRYEN